MEAPRVRIIDAAVAAVVAVALLVVMVGIEGDADDRSFDALAGVLVVVAGGVLVLHRRAPLVVLALTTSALAVYGLVGYPGGPVYLTWYGAIFAVSVARGPAKAWVPAAVSTGVLLGIAFHDSKRLVLALFLSWCAGALLLGGSVRGRRAERAAAEERARHLVETREEEARRRVAEERVRIARDLHDWSRTAWPASRCRPASAPMCWTNGRRTHGPPSSPSSTPAVMHWPSCGPR